METAELSTASTMSQGYLANAAVNRKYFPKKPANGGMPARESIESAKTAAIKGCFLLKPLNASKDPSPRCSATAI